MRLKEITFTFENCDYLKIDGKYVGDFVVDDIKTSIRRVACNAIMKMDSANTFAIEIHKDANKERYAFDQTDCDRFKEMVFDRFTQYNDITHIDFELEETYVDEGQIPKVESYSYYLNWTGDSDYSNESQKSLISKCGNLYIYVGKNNLEDYFPSEIIDDEDTMDFSFNMMDVGDKYSNPDRYNNESEN